MTVLSVDVGNGSKAQHLSGSALTAVVISSTLTGVNVIGVTSEDGRVYDGAGTPSVADRTPDQQPWRRSSRGTAERQRCHILEHCLGPSVYQWNAKVAVGRTFLHQSFVSKKTHVLL